MPYPLAPINVTASKAITPSHTGTITTINAAAGLTLTLPAATGSGYHFKFFIGTTVTSNNVIIAVANASDIMSGIIVTAQDAGDTATAWETAVDSDTITMNGSTKGGIKGDYIEIIDVAANLWIVNGRTSATGTEVTPFSAAV